MAPARITCCSTDRNAIRGRACPIAFWIRYASSIIRSKAIRSAGSVIRLQTATRALQDGADDELIVAALIHDVGDELAPYNHAEIAAGIIRPYVRPEVTWIVEQHGLVQTYYYAHHIGGDRNVRDRLKGHQWYRRVPEFLSPLGPEFVRSGLSEPAAGGVRAAVRRIFSRKAHDPRYTRALDP